MTTIAADPSDLKYCLAEDVDPFFAHRCDIDDAYAARLALWWHLGLTRSVTRCLPPSGMNRRIATFRAMIEREDRSDPVAVVERIRSRA